jgi:hypothetical protein
MEQLSQMSPEELECHLEGLLKKSGLLEQSIGRKVTFEDVIEHIYWRDEVMRGYLEQYKCYVNCSEPTQGKVLVKDSVHPFDWHLFKAAERVFPAGDKLEKVMARGQTNNPKYPQKHGYGCKDMQNWWNRYERMNDADVFPKYYNNRKVLLNIKLRQHPPPMSSHTSLITTVTPPLAAASTTQPPVPDEVTVDTEKEQTDDEYEAPIVVASKKRKIAPASLGNRLTSIELKIFGDSYKDMVWKQRIKKLEYQLELDEDDSMTMAQRVSNIESVL